MIWAGPNDLVRFSCGVSCFVAHHRHRIVIGGVGARASPRTLHFRALQEVANFAEVQEVVRMNLQAVHKTLFSITIGTKGEHRAL